MRLMLLRGTEYAVLIVRELEDGGKLVRGKNLGFMSCELSRLFGLENGWLGMIWV